MTPLQRHIITLLGKIAQPGKADEIADMGAKIGLGITDATRVPKNLEATISDLVHHHHPHKKIRAVVCAITALIIRFSGVACIPSSPENKPVLRSTVQATLELLANANDIALLSALDWFMAAASIDESVAKIVVGGACQDTPEAVEVVTISAIAMAECWGNTGLST
jgi:hypothetical protein